MTPQTPIPATPQQPALFDDPSAVYALSVDDLLALSDRVASEAGGIVRQVRRAAGLLASAMRRKMGEGAYGTWAQDFADRLGVSPRTLYEWRHKVEEAADSPSPLTRKSTSEARKEISARASKTSAGGAPSSAVASSPPAEPPVVEPEEPASPPSGTAPSALGSTDAFLAEHGQVA